jgi:uncharacterized protein (PEP-CTERM system associated)
MTGLGESGGRTKPHAGSSRSLWLVGVCAACSSLGPATSHAQGPLPASTAAPWVKIIPSLTLEETFTDNANLTASDHKSDFITRGQFGLETAIDTGRTTLMAKGDFDYDRYARQPSLSGWSADANGQGSYSIIRDRLTLEATGTLTNGYTSNADTSVVDRSGTPNRVLLGAYDLGPHLNARLGDFADLSAAMQFGQIFYSAADASHVTTLPDNDSMVQFSAQADTGARSRVTQLATRVELDGDDQGYRSANAIQTVYIQTVPTLRLLGRAGYDYIVQPDAARISGEILSAGVEFTPNQRSRITLEGGQRYGGPTWAASANVQLGAKVGLTASYTEVFQPDQLYVSSALLAQSNNADPLPTTIVPGGLKFIPSLYNEASLAKSAVVHVIFAGRVQSLDVGTNWSDRYFYSTHDHGREWVSNAVYGRRLKPQLTLTVTATYARTYQSPIYGPSEDYTGTVGLTYTASPSVDLYLRYGATLSRQHFPSDLTFNENAVQLAVRKRL